MEQKYLRKVGTNEVFPWAVGIASRKDMIECDIDGNFTDGTTAEAITSFDGIPPYLKKVGTDEIFPYTPFLALRKDMIPCLGPKILPLGEKPPAALTALDLEEVMVAPAVEPELTPEPEKPETPEPEPSAADLQAARMSKIRDAVKLVDPSNYVPAKNGRPAMPAVADVEKLSGVTKVKVAEILDALKG